MKSSWIKCAGVSLILMLSAIDVGADVTIRGVPSCVSWLVDDEQNKGDGWVRVADQSWLLGFLSGQALESDKNVLKGTDSDTLYRWMDNYCMMNPLKNIADGGDALFYELAKQKGLK